MKIALIYVIDPPALTIQAILLSASVRRHLPDADLIAYCPEEKINQVPPQMREYLAHTGTHIATMPTEGSFAPRYKQGNKLLAAAQPRAHDFTIFLDTDIVVWQPFDLAGMVEPGAVSAAPEGRYTWGKKAGHWETAYGVFGLTVPEDRVKLVRTGAMSPPYFNAGVVGFPTEFGKLWLETAQELDRSTHAVSGRRPWLDQIALPIAMRRAGLSHKHLDDRFNLSTSHTPVKDTMPRNRQVKKQAEIDRLNGMDPFLIHYHAIGSLKDLRYAGYEDDLLQEFTIFRSLEDMDWKKHIDFDPKALMAEFWALKKIPGKERTAEQRKQFAAVHKRKEQLKVASHHPDRFTNVWPASILPVTKPQTKVG